MSEEITQCRKCKREAADDLVVFQDSELCGDCDRDFWTWVPLKRSPIVMPDKKTMVATVMEFIG